MVTISKVTLKPTYICAAIGNPSDDSLWSSIQWSSEFFLSLKGSAYAQVVPKPIFHTLPIILFSANVI